jgi:hypothetical protein
VLLSTMKDLTPRTYEVRGFVLAHAVLGAIGGGKTDKMIQSLIEQAQRLGGDGIVDLQTVLGGDSAHCVMTGTAVRITS